MKQINTYEQYQSDMLFFKDWLTCHPNRVDPEVRAAGTNWIEVEIEAARKEIKNARLARRTSRLRTRLKELVVVIISQNSTVVKEDLH
ncbi:hypothetical protein [Paenibacillus albus]|uniref:Core-binding (CB) domain-containing protein n=1 Tax=Paenibacillus albus TaxID=2495582 RepID=A0A3S9ACA4_9BACL|nr:hypothetical protein [Paenibacillus albus]AZN43382.1 hypothetical protein EJC50_29585 [Paenibacillus albus]